MKKYLITKQFLPGEILEGLTVTETISTSTAPKVGFIGGGPGFGSRYRIVAVQEVEFFRPVVA